jgi:hypothetical protein
MNDTEATRSDVFVSIVGSKLKEGTLKHRVTMSLNHRTSYDAFFQKDRIFWKSRGNLTSITWQRIEANNDANNDARRCGAPIMSHKKVQLYKTFSDIVKTQIDTAPPADPFCTTMLNWAFLGPPPPPGLSAMEQTSTLTGGLDMYIQPSMKTMYRLPSELFE